MRWLRDKIGSRHRARRYVVQPATPEAARVAEGFEPLSFEAKLAAALVALTELVDVTGAEVAHWQDLEEHLWAGLTAWGDAFDPWYEHENALLDVARGHYRRGDSLPAWVTDALDSTPLAPEDFRRALVAIVALHHDHLFAGLVTERVQRELATIIEVTTKYGVEFPSPHRFATPSALRGPDRRRPAAAEVQQWRFPPHDP